MPEFDLKPDLSEQERYELADELGKLFGEKVVAITRWEGRIIVEIEDKEEHDHG